MTSTSRWRFARALSGALAFLAAASAGAADDAPVVAGPFEIVPRVKKIGSGRFPNLTANPFGRAPVTVFSVKHRGRAVVAADDQDEFWDALVLEGAPRPTVIAAVDAVYLFTEDAGRLRVETLAAARGDIATLQWLDAKGGQPDEPRLVTLRSRTGESRTLAGGTLLLLNSCVVLDVATIRTYPVRFDDADGKLGGYVGPNEPAKSISPGRTQLVVVGSRSRDDRVEYALLAAEYATGRIRAVPFDRTVTRFGSAWDATPDWVARYFQWTRQADGAERLEPRTGAVPRP